MEQTTNNSIDYTSKTLSIQVSLNGLSFCTVDSDQQITAIEHDNFGIQLTPEQVLDKIKYTLDNNTVLKDDFKTIEVIYHNDLYTLVPKPLFNQDMAKEYLQYNIKVLENDFIAYDELDQHDIVTVYIPYANINNFFFDTFGSFTYKHANTILTNSLLTQQKNSEATTVFVNMSDKLFDVVIIKKGKLILENTFRYENKEDFLYYLMFTTEQTKLNPEEFMLVFLGDITKKSECFKIAHKYIRKITFGKYSRDLKISPTITPFEPHQHFTLLSHF
ncbi:DUF3822 family protein [Aquimarina mytili]|uniref:DUF3822 family protein n=1 Tax=Aquimarina mytili TaxID=874423 RepID=A0A936ZWJ7_9FLAO|nr:DUF3822 family protein [Aquimarina mytili]MBL0683295.1 DUF3822 family protein [Aquimarina mytili]